MNASVSRKTMISCLLAGMLGCLLMGGSDWLMIYGDTAFEGNLAWLTLGVARIPPERNALALLLAFPAVICYAAGLFAVRHFIYDRRQQKTYSALTALGLTPWLCLHLLYIMILFLFAYLTGGGWGQEALSVCEALFGQFSWIILPAEVIMLLPFLYLPVITARGKTVHSRWMALNNPLLYYAVLKALTLVMPDVPARLAFTNGLMSESMLLWFLVFLLGKPRTK